MTRTSNKPMQPLPTAMPTRSHTPSRRSVKTGSAAGILSLVLAVIGCAAATPATISSDRTVYTVVGPVQVKASPTAPVQTLTSTEEAPLFVEGQTWIQERYQLERAIRLRLERCEVELNDYRIPTTDGAEKRTMIPWPLLVPFRQPALDHLVHP